MIIGRFGEIFLKSKPVKKRFLSQLGNNMRTALRREEIEAKVKEKRLRLYVYPKHDSKESEALNTLKRVFGIVSLSRATETEPEKQRIKEKTEEMIKEWPNTGTFAVRAQRITKDHPFTSKDLEEELGAAINNEKNLEVDLDNPDRTLYVEIYNDKAHVFTEKIRGTGGVPLGVAGTLKSPLKTPEDLAAAWMMMKRGCMIKPINAKDINPELKKSFQEWNLTRKEPEGPVGTVTGSTKMEKSIKDHEEYQRPVYTPLIGMDQKEIEQLKCRIMN